ncbi:MAG TPA: MFS transporter [Bradyrhizobium sp.]|nr:MFS transporter [Bradyrhizobium sp.]
MQSETQIPILLASAPRFARRLALFYGAVFALIGSHLPFFPLWMKAVGIDASWIGIISAVPSVTRFTALPLVTGLAERWGSLRGAMILTTGATALGFALIGTQHVPVLVFLVYAATACMWTPIVPLTDAYALRGVARYGLDYGPLRLWGSAAFVAGALACGLLADLISARYLIWIIATLAAFGALVSLALLPMEKPSASSVARHGMAGLLRQRSFLVIILASALIQSSHAAYYIFASITWQRFGFDGLTIAALWSVGVVAEIVVFALSPRLTLRPSSLVMIGAFAAMARWLITAQEPPVTALVVVQLAHGLTFGLTQLGTMGLMVRHVALPVMAAGQGYLAACGGIVNATASILCGLAYARYGQGVYDMMAAMAACGGLLTWVARRCGAFSREGVSII